MPRHLTLAGVKHASRHGRRRRRLPILAVLLAGVLVAGAGAGSAVLLSGSSEAGDATCARGSTDLVVASSAEKAATLKRLAADFSRSAKDDAGRCIRVTVVLKASGAAQSALARGWSAADGPAPDVWCPSGSIWLELLNDRLAKAGQSPLVSAPKAVPHIASSPMVFAMPRPMAEALGWPKTPIGWGDLLELASSGTGWAAYGHPEWGRFTLGKTNPNFSHAGLEGTIASYYAAVGRTSGLTMRDIARPSTRKFVAGVEQSIVRYGDNTASFLTDWQRADAEGKAMSYISALVTEENLIAPYNDGNPTADPDQAGRNPKPQVPLVAIYPKEGTFIADHPYAVLDADWVTDQKRSAATAFLTYLQSPAVQKSWRDNHFRGADGTPSQDAGPAQGVIPSQPAKTLTLPSAAVADAVLASWSQLRKTANVISVIDVSGSMAAKLPGSAQTKLDAARKAAISSLGLFTDRDEVGLWSFSGGVRGQQDYRELVPTGPMSERLHGSPRRKVLAEEIEGLRPGGDTGLYNTISAAQQEVLRRYRDDRINAVVVLTDGKNDADGGLSLKKLLKRLQQNDTDRPVRIVTIAYGPEADPAALQKISQATKGASYVAPSSAEISKIYSAALSNF